jgi:hypothetical protein
MVMVSLFAYGVPARPDRPSLPVIPPGWAAVRLANGGTTAPEVDPLVTPPFAVGIRSGFPFASRTKRQVKTRHDRGKTIHDKTKQNKTSQFLVLSWLVYVLSLSCLVQEDENTRLIT